jgi:hypothetical protein
MPAPARIAVVGATGSVRRSAVSVLERTGLPVEATSRSTVGPPSPCRAYIRTVARLPAHRPLAVTLLPVSRHHRCRGALHRHRSQEIRSSSSAAAATDQKVSPTFTSFTARVATSHRSR